LTMYTLKHLPRVADLSHQMLATLGARYLAAQTPRF
jgi:hypothetical protein